MTEPLLRVKNLKKYFPIRGGLLSREIARVHAVDNVSFEIMPGETLGLVGESGCGKSTTGRSILRLIEPTSGEVWFGAQNVTTLDKRSLRALRKEMQIIFQDPYASLNPRMTVGSIIGEALVIHKLAATRKRREPFIPPVVAELSRLDRLWRSEQYSSVRLREVANESPIEGSSLPHGSRRARLAGLGGPVHPIAGRRLVHVPGPRSGPDRTRSRPPAGPRRLAANRGHAPGRPDPALLLDDVGRAAPGPR